jgi:hypothetical protein
LDDFSINLYHNKQYSNTSNHWYFCFNSFVHHVVYIYNNWCHKSE